MIVEYYKDLKFMSQKVICKTELFGKNYYYMKDVDGTIYLVGMDEDGNPKFA